MDNSEEEGNRSDNDHKNEKIIQLTDYDSEIDPFASEIDENENNHDKESESEIFIAENTLEESEYIDNIEGEEGKAINNDTTATATVIATSVSNYIRILAPMVWEFPVQVEISFPFTIAELFGVLKEEHAAIFDSKGKFTGRIYCENRLIENDSMELIENGEKCLVLIHDLMTGEVTEVAKIEIAAKEQVINPAATFMNRIKNLWISKEKTTAAAAIAVQEVELKNMKMSSGGEIPEFIEKVLKFLQRPEMIQEGLFRLSGNFTRIQNLQERVKSGESLENFNLTVSDCHNVTSLLKQFLRTLPEPLLTFELYEAWQSLGQWTGQTGVAVRIGQFLVSQLPPLNRRILRALLGFLYDRLQDTEVTRMTACNYGTVMGPNLLWHPLEDRQTRDSATLGLSLQSSTLASQICTLFLQRFDEIFTDFEGGAEGNLVGGAPVMKGSVSVMAFGKALYDFKITDRTEMTNSTDITDSASSADNDGTIRTTGTSTSTSDNSSSSSFDGMKTDQIIFVSSIDDSVDGWWLGYISPHENDRKGVSKFPSNYLQVIAQRSDEDILRRAAVIIKG